MTYDDVDDPAAAAARRCQQHFMSNPCTSLLRPCTQAEATIMPRGLKVLTETCQSQTLCLHGKTTATQRSTLAYT